MIYKEERELRNISLNIFKYVSEPHNLETIIEMIEKGGAYRYNQSRDPDYNSLMRTWELISEFHKNPDYVPDETKEVEIIVDEMTIGGNGAIIKAYVFKNGQYVNITDRENHWFGTTWMSYSMYIKDAPESSNVDNLKEGIWKTITDFTMFWCNQNLPNFNELINNN